MNELLYLYMMSNTLSDSELLKPKQIGTFLRYAITDAHQSGNDEDIQVMLKELRNLMVKDGFDFLQLVSMFGVNDFTNLELLEGNEIDNNYFALQEFKECYEDLSKISKEPTHELKDLINQKDNPYLEISPCFNISNNPECQGYCLWVQDVLMKWPTQRIDELLR